MAEQNPSNRPDVTNPWYDSQLAVWTFLQDMLDGQDAVKAKREVYLRAEPAEDPQDYSRRLDRSVFFEDYRDCVVNLTGISFRKPVTLSDDVPVEIRGLQEVRDKETGEVKQEPKEGLAENIDNAGTHINVFLQRVFQDGFFGHTFIVVDMPPKTENSTNAAGVTTAQDQLKAGARAYWTQRSVVDTLNWRVAVINGQTMLTQITFQECTKEPDGMFGEVEVTRWRVYRINELGNAEWQIWEQTGEGDDIEILMTASAEIRTKQGKPLKRLPVAVHYGEYEGFLKSRPPLKGIADINLAYYQKYSDLSNIEHYTCAVTLCLIGVDDQQPNRTLGGNCVITIPTIGGDAKFLTVDGDSIPALERDLQNLEKRMVHKGLDFVQEEHRVPTTATEVLLSYSQRTSKLAMMTQNLINCAEEALSITAEMEGLPEGGSVSLGVDESALSLSPEEIDKYSLMNERGQLTLRTLWAMMARADKLPDNFDPIEEERGLREAAERQMELNAKQFDAGQESTD
jgi:uncharacterized protein DUF4055